MRRKQHYDHGGDKGIATPAMQFVEQTYQEGEGWEPNVPTTIQELMGQIPDDLSAEVDTTCPFHGCLLEHRTSDNGFNYVKYPEYPVPSLEANKKYTSTYKPWRNNGTISL